MLWPVFIDHWQHESGGRAFAVGDAVRWSLVLDDGHRRQAPDEVLVTARFQLRRHPKISTGGSIAIASRLQAWYTGPEQPGSTITFTGLLREDHHTLSLVATEGIVRQLEVVTQRYEEASDGTLVIAPGSWESRVVDRSPERFTPVLEPGASAATGGWRSARLLSRETGMLAWLAV
jgi:Family of unknown function (DUF6578)